MPDILIRMEMPRTCADCHDADLPTAIAWLGAKCPCVYGMNKQGVYDLRHKRHPDCPLIELPPHGDLIDRDALLNKINAYVCGSQDSEFIKNEIIKAMPVVVPAERSGE